VLRSVEPKFFTDDSGRRISPIFNGREVQGFLTVEDGTDTSTRNVGKELLLDAA
jgi:hypothetical protein